MIPLITAALGLATTVIPLMVQTTRAVKRGDADEAARLAAQAAERQAIETWARERLQ